MRIALILVYFGEWPIWFPAFLQSCRYNESIDWLIFTDIPPPPNAPQNVSFVPFTMAQFKSLASSKIGFQITVDEPYKLVDFKPAYGLVFDEYLRGYEFWGHCDLDVIWGDLRAFVTDSILRENDIFSARKNAMCGHFSLFRNTPQVSNLFRRHAKYASMFANARAIGFDEAPFTRVVADLATRAEVRVHWPEFVLGREFARVLRQFPNRWYWRRGKLFNGNDHDKEIMYLHFMSWKKTMHTINFGYNDAPHSFEVSRNGILASE